MSIGSSNPIGGSNVAFSIFARSPKSPGGAIQGWMPQQTQNVDKTYPEFEQIRWTLKEAWNTTYPSQLRQGIITSKQSNIMIIVAKSMWPTIAQSSVQGSKHGW